ncbi:hypothetical protein [Pseudothermotoga sp.]
MTKWLTCLFVLSWLTTFGQAHMFYCINFIQEDSHFATLDTDSHPGRAILLIDYQSGGFVKWHVVLTVFENRVVSLTREMPEGPRTMYFKVEESDLALILNYVRITTQRKIGEPEVNSDLYRIKHLEKPDAELIIYVSPRYYETKDHPAAQLIEVLRKWLWPPED